VTSPASSIAATIMSLLLSVVRHGICLYVATASRANGVSAADVLLTKGDIVPHFLRVMWGLGGPRRRPHVVMVLVAIIMLPIDACAVSGVVRKAASVWAARGV
jgi:hypothetical protein